MALSFTDMPDSNESGEPESDELDFYVFNRFNKTNHIFLKVIDWDTKEHQQIVHRDLFKSLVNTRICLVIKHDFSENTEQKQCIFYER